MSQYDPQTFATMTFVGANSTSAEVLPVGEYPATIEKHNITSWQKRDDPSIGGLKVTFTLKASHPTLEAKLGRTSSFVDYEVMLDLTPEGGLDMGKGKNVKLGKLREAIGLNDPSRPFSFDMTIGHSLVATVKHEEYKGNLYAKVSGVAKG
jgi:hypothetical protein